MKLATRVFVTTSLVAAAAVLGLTVASHRLLRPYLEDEMAGHLEREGQLIAALLPADSLRWSAVARTLGTRLGHRVTLIDPTGAVRGDSAVAPAASSGRENQLREPEVQQALALGHGRATRTSASTNERRLFVAVRGGPPGLAVVSLSTPLAAVEAQVGGLERAVVLASLGVLGAALLAAGALSWRVARDVTHPLAHLTAAARAIAEGQTPAFPDARAPEVAQHMAALRGMQRQLAQRFAEIVREREETATLIETMTEGVLAADARGAIVTLNRAARRLLGYGAADRLPALAELFHEKAARDLVQAVLDGGEAEPRELERGALALLLTARALPNGGVLLVIRDVTELRRLEAVRRDFVANVSHELKTPLTSIVGYAETLATEDAGEDAERFARTILNNARRMQELVDDLLDLSRIESRRWQPTRARVDVAGVVGEAWAEFLDRARTRRIKITVAAGAARHVTADPDALRQILTNLFDNALRHTPPGGRITVTAEASRGGVTIAVADTGSGIASEHLPRIFERFYRADPGRSREEGGTGLGLAIVKHLMEAHGGRVEARSTLGEGTTILLFFPGEPDPAP